MPGLGSTAAEHARTPRVLALGTAAAPGRPPSPGADEEPGLDPVMLPGTRTVVPGALSVSATAVPPVTLQAQPTPGALKPLQAIRAEFNEILAAAYGSASGARAISAEDIARHWERLAEDDVRLCGRARLSAQGKQAIALRVAQLMQEMDLRHSGQVGMEEWVHYMLLARSGFSTRQVNVLLDKALSRNKAILQDLQRMFDAADSSKSGTLTFAEILSMYSRKLWHLRPSVSGPAKNMTDEELGAGDPEQFAREVLQAMDINGDERVSYPEFMAYSLGRRKHEVQLHLYDLSNGAAQSLSPWLIGAKLEGIWHTGVVVYGKEYYYSKDTVYADAGDTSFGKPTRVLHLGYTLWRQDELHEFVTSELKPIFQRETYDVVCNNCNHFSDRVCMYLVGKHPPPEVLDQPKMLLRARAVRVIRPVLNWWLRDRIVVREKGVALPPGVQRLAPGEQPPLGTIVCIHAATGSGHPILGQVTGCPEPRDGETVCEPALGLAAGGGLGGGGPGLDGGCGSIWSGTCGLVHSSAAAALGAGPAARDGLWVQYFDVVLTSSSGSRAQVRTEYIAHSRLSLGGLSEKEGEATFLRALQAIAAPGGHASPGFGARSGAGSGRGAIPHRVPVPTAMSEEPRTVRTICGPAVSQL